MKNFSEYNNKAFAIYSDVAGAPSRIGSLDIGGSTVDSLFVEAIVANEPTTVLEEAGIVRVYKISDSAVDRVTIPVVPVADLTWKRIARDVQDTGSEFGASQMTAATYTVLTPSVFTTNVFFPDTISLANRTPLEFWAGHVAVSAKKYKEQQGIGSLCTEANIVNILTATQATAGSVAAGSTLTPQDLSRAKKTLMSGSYMVKADFALLHPNQYFTLATSAEYAPGYTTVGGAVVPNRSKFDSDGMLTAFDGMELLVSELIPSVGSTTVSADVTNNLYTVLGHPVIVGKKGQALVRAEHEAIKVTRQHDALRHGDYVIVDQSFAYAVPVGSSLCLIRCAQ